MPEADPRQPFPRFSRCVSLLRPMAELPSATDGPLPPTPPARAPVAPRQSGRSRTLTPPTIILVGPQRALPVMAGLVPAIVRP